MRRKTIVTLIILLAPLFGLAQFANAQTYPIATTTYVTTTTSVINSQSTVADNPPVGQCAIYYSPFNATSGERIQGTITANQPVDFYIMSASQASNLLAPGTPCDPNSVELNGAGAEVSQTKITSYSIDWTPPVGGTYYFVIINLHSTASNSITLVAGTQVTQTVSSTFRAQREPSNGDTINDRG